MVEPLSKEELVAVANNVWEQWMDPLHHSDGTLVSRETRFLHLIGVIPSVEQPPDFSRVMIEQVKKAMNLYFQGLTLVWNNWRSAKLHLDESTEEATKRLQAVGDYVWYSWLQLYSSQRCLYLERGVPLEVPEQLLSLRVTSFLYSSHEDLTPWQRTCLFLLDKLYELGYRRYNADCYEEIKVDGVGTHAWRSVMSIEKFVYSAIPKEQHYEMWQNLTHNANNAKQLIEHLKCTMDAQFPQLEKKRGVISFSNGVYICEEDAFYPYKAESGRSVADLPNDLVSCNYIDEPLEYEQYGDGQSPPWQSIETPALQSIFDCQELSEIVCGWIYVGLGRFLYKLNHLDSWQVMFFFKGVAGSGKSTICKMAANFYGPGDVGVLSNMVEKQFGLSQFTNKLAFIAPELKRDLQLDQADVQTIVAGEDMMVATKGKDPKTITWELPGLFGGNELPDWQNNSGSISRRFVLVHFAKKVSRVDTRLAQKLRAELPAIIRKCNIAYLSAVNEYGNESIWEHLPDYFRETQKVMAESCNALVSFLSSDWVELGPENYCKQQEFIAQFNEFSKASSFNRARWEADFYRAIFDDHKLVIRNDELFWPPNGDQKRQGKYIIGCGLVNLK